MFEGGEDDDMYYRLKNSGIGFERPNRTTGYQMLKHYHTARNMERFDLIEKGKVIFKTEGLNSVKYTLHGIVKYPLFTHILVDVGKHLKFNANKNQTK